MGCAALRNVNVFVQLIFCVVVHRSRACKVARIELRLFIPTPEIFELVPYIVLMTDAFAP